MVGEASGRMQKADCRDEIALPEAMLAWLKYRKQRTRNSRKRFLVFFCSVFVKARVVYRLLKVTDLEGHDISYAEYNPYTKRVESAVDLVKGRVYYIEIHGNEFYSEYSQVEIRTSIKKHSHRLGSYTYIYESSTGLFYRECLCQDCPYRNLFFKCKPSISKLTKGKKKFTAKISYKYDHGPFQIQYSTNKKFKKAKSTTLYYPESKTIKKLSKKKTYYVRVRAYTTEDNGISKVKVYSPWSAVKKVKTK